MDAPQRLAHAVEELVHDLLGLGSGHRTLPVHGRIRRTPSLLPRLRPRREPAARLGANPGPGVRNRGPRVQDSVRWASNSG